MYIGNNIMKIKYLKLPKSTWFFYQSKYTAYIIQLIAYII